MTNTPNRITQLERRLATLERYVRFVRKHALVTYDTGSNGEYVRLENGLQVCWDRQTRTHSGGSAALTSLAWTFPAVFSAAPNAWAVHGRAAGLTSITNLELLACSHDGASTTAVTFHLYTTDATGFQNNDTITFDMLAVGLWK